MPTCVHVLRLVQAIANRLGRTLHLPVDFNRHNEVLRDTDRSHCRCATCLQLRPQHRVIIPVDLRVSFR